MDLFKTKNQLKAEIEALEKEKREKLELWLKHEYSEKNRINGEIFNSFQDIYSKNIEKEKELLKIESQIENKCKEKEAAESEIRLKKEAAESEIRLKKEAAESEIRLKKEAAESEIEFLKKSENIKSEMLERILIEKDKEIERLALFVSNGQVKFEQFNTCKNSNENSNEIPTEDFRRGELILVSNDFKEWTKRVFVAKTKAAFICLREGRTNMESIDCLNTWEFAKKI